MKKNLLPLIFIALISYTDVAYAQMVGTSIYLPGRYLEIGIAKNGSWGPASPPAGYHAYTGPNLASVYDYGHDGWATGTPGFFGDFTYPGTPFEGWCIEANGYRSDAFYTTDAAWTGTGFWNQS